MSIKTRLQSIIEFLTQLCDIQSYDYDHISVDDLNEDSLKSLFEKIEQLLDVIYMGFTD